jgi:hypothetical protein
MSDQIIVLSDRIKELTHTTGVQPLRLDGAATGFSAFGDFYAHGDALYYAVTDGTDYEVGSGQYILDSSDNLLVRFPFRSTNSNNAVEFKEGIKEVYVTYPGQYAVFTASGLGPFTQPKPSGLAFWGSSQILCHDDEFVWSPSGNKLGISQSDPQYAIDVGGTVSYSQIQASGFLDGGSGILFSGGSALPQDITKTASGGRQLEPFFRNELDNQTGTDAVFSLSGLVDHRLLFQKQEKGTIFAGPLSGCTPVGCSPNYPTFRLLNSGDIPSLPQVTANLGEIRVNSASGVAISGWAAASFTGGGGGGSTADILANSASGVVISGIANTNKTNIATNVTNIASNLVEIRTNSASGVAISGYIDDKVGGLAGGYSSWSITDGTVAADIITSLQTVTISGASGIGTHYDSSTNILVLNPSGLSGVLQPQVTANLVEIRANSASGNFNLGEIRTNSASGNFNLGEIRVNSASGAAISGYAEAYTDAAVYGAGSYTYWTISDGGAGDNITHGETVTITGASGIGTHYDSSTNTLVLNPSGLSGVLQPQVTANLVEIRANSASGNFNLGEIRVNSASGNFNLGEIRTNSASGNFNLTEIRTNSASGDYNLTEIRANSASGVVISGIAEGGPTITAGSGLTRVENTIYMDVTGSGQLEHLIFNNDQIRIGTNAGDSFDLGDSGSFWIAIGKNAGYGASGNDCTVMIGEDAGKLSSGCDYTNMIGSGAGYLATGCTYTNMIGYNAGYQATGCSNTNMIGFQAGRLASGCDYTEMIGYHAGYQATGCDYTEMIGYWAGYRASGCDYTNMMGYLAGYQATGCGVTNMIGHHAGFQASGCDYTNMIGYWAGLQATGCDYTNMMGYQAGYQATGVNSSIFIGHRAGYRSSSDNSVYIGQYAGAKLWGTSPGRSGKDSLIINNMVNASPAPWADSASDGIIDISDIIHGVYTSTTNKTLNIGKTPSDESDLSNITLTIRPTAATHVVLKTCMEAAHSADQIQSSVDVNALANTIVNKDGYLQLPVALGDNGSSGSSLEFYTHTSSTDDKYKIDKGAGVVVFYKIGSTKYLMVSDGSYWYKTSSLTQM